MANIKISDLTSAASVADTNEFEINEAGTSKKVSASQIQAYIESNLTTGSILLKGDGSGGVASATTDNGTNGQYLRTNGDGTFAWETLSSDPTMGGDLTGTASNAQLGTGVVGSTELATDAVTNAKVANDAIGIAELSATGTPSSSTYLRGDNTWASISAGVSSGSQTFTTSYNCQATATGNNVRAGGYGANSTFGGTSINAGVKTANANFQKNLITYVNNCNQQPNGRTQGAETFVSGSTVYVRAHSRYNNCSANCVCNC